MTIEVYPSTMQGEPVEVYVAGNMTLGDWFSSKNIAYEGRDHQPVVIVVNGYAIPPAQWAEYRFTSSDRIQILCIPQGGAFNALGSIISKVFNVAFGFLMPKTKSPGSRNTPSGDKLEPSNATANQVRLGEPVPEHAGTFRRFPDYLTQPRRFFVNKREQHVTFLACVGVGSYYIDPATIKIGDTPFDTLDGAAQYEIFPPGTDVSTNWAHDNWYSVEEVGGTSSGTAGLELSAEALPDITPDASSYVLTGQTMEAVGGTWPEPWAPGTVINFSSYRSYLVERIVEEEGAYVRITGEFKDLVPTRGLSFIAQIDGSSQQTVTIDEVDVDATGVGTITLLRGVDLPAGNRVMWLRRSGFYGYQITSIDSATHITVRQVISNGSPLVWGGFVDYAGPISISVRDATVFGEWAGPFRVCPQAERVTNVELDFFFPQGLNYLTDSGKLENRSVSIQVQYRDANATGAGWTTVGYTYTDKTMDQIGFTERISLDSPILPEVRVRRVGAREASTQVNDTVQWYGLRSMLPTRSSYPNWTTVAIRLSSGGKLGANAENKINLVATRVLPELMANGQWSNPAPTRHIAAFFRYILTTIGYTDAQIDMAELRRLNDVWNARGDTFNYVFDETTVKEALDTVLAAGMSELTIEEGRIRPVRDERRTVFEQAYSAQNMTGLLRTSFKTPRVDDVDGVEVEYTDEQTWTKATVLCLLPADEGRKLEKVSLKGAFDHTRAWRIGMRRRRVLRYRNREYSFSTEMDALNSRYLSYVPLIDEGSEYSQSAILTHISTHEGRALLRVNEPLNWKDGEGYVVAYRNLEGVLVGPFKAEPGPDEYSLFAAIPEPYPVVTLKHEPPHVYFGTTAQWSFPALITGVTPQGLDAVNVTAENDHPAVYDDDDASPPA
jgi:sulfur carrier protein ThiS